MKLDTKATNMIYRKRLNPRGDQIMRIAGRPQSLFFLSLLAFTFVSASTADAQAPKLRVAYTAFAGTFTILWVGKDAGLYQKHGADMELLYIGSSTRAVQALLAGDLDIVYSAAGAVVDANLAGADGTIIFLHNVSHSQHRRSEGQSCRRLPLRRFL